ncbi:hypothetical protein J4Q44_G00330300 [Coregonus suidteri]|uniref:Uncharacterized protein n=1 Tax=Coregonus suidteri TaxID=861788 RepID=A0AAN8KS09_9TELE
MLQPGLPQSAPAEAQPPAPGVPSTSGTSGPGGTTFYPSSIKGEHLIINSLTGLPPGACWPSTGSWVSACAKRVRPDQDSSQVDPCLGNQHMRQLLYNQDLAIDFDYTNTTS